MSFLALFWILSAILLTCCFAQTCTSTSCGLAGTCNTNGYCICGSNFYPDSTLDTCTNAASCTPANFGASPNITLLQQFDSPFLPLFASGNLQVNFTFNTIYDASRDIVFQNKYTGQVCAQMSSDISSASSLSNFRWSQGVSVTADPTQCQDTILANLAWTSVSTCMRSPNNQNLYEFTVYSLTNIYNEGNATSTIGKRTENAGSFSFNTSRDVSFLFASTVTANSSADSFYVNAGQFAVSGTFTVVSYTLDSANLLLTVSFLQYLTYPVVLNQTSYTVSNISAPLQSLTFGSVTCDPNSQCSIPFTAVFNLASLNCAGFQNDAVTFSFLPACYSGAPSTTCGGYMAALAGKVVNDSFLMSAEWCPLVNQVSVSLSSFALNNNGVPVTPSQAIANPQIQGVMTIHVGVWPTSFLFDSATITSLTFNQGPNSAAISPGQLDNGDFTQSFTPPDTTTNLFTVSFNHNPLTSNFPSIDFTQEVYYVATVQAIFGATKKRFEVSGKLRANNQNPSGSLSASSPRFLIQQQSTLQSSQPSQTNIPLVVGLSVGIGGAALVSALVILVIIGKSKTVGIGGAQILQEI